MNIHLRQKRDYIAMHNTHLTYHNLSLEAKGLLSMLYDLAGNGIPINDKRIVTMTASDVEELRAAFKELNACGYLYFKGDLDDLFV